MSDNLLLCRQEWVELDPGKQQYDTQSLDPLMESVNAFIVGTGII